MLEGYFWDLRVGRIRVGLRKVVADEKLNLMCREIEIMKETLMRIRV